MVKRETPATAASRSMDEKPLPRAAMSFVISVLRKPGDQAEAEPHGARHSGFPLRSAPE